MNGLKEIASSLPEPRNPRYHTLDAWRGIACLLVVVFHSTLYLQASEASIHSLPWRILVRLTAYLWVGVPLFFVISGYCISATADSSRRKALAPRRYFVRRFRRIFPAYWVFLALTVLFVGGLECLSPHLFSDSIHSISRPQQLNLWQWLGNITLTETWRYHVSGAGERFLSGQAWTLCYEEQFYFVVGIILFLMPRRWFFPALSAVSVAVLLSIYVYRFGGITAGFFFDGRWLQFAAGVLVYYRINYASRLQGRLLDSILILVVLWSVHQPLIFLQTTFGPRQELFVASSFALALSVFHRWDKEWNSAAISRPFTFCGVMCYSLYLVHWPVVKAISHSFYRAVIKSVPATCLLTVPICLLASIVVGRVFYLLVERKFLNRATQERLPAEFSVKQAAMS